MLTRTVDARPDQPRLKVEGQTDCVNFSSRKMFSGRFVRRLHATRSAPGLAVLILLLTPVLSNAVELKPETVQAWDAYIRARSLRVKERASGHAPFLWVDESHEMVQRVQAGEILAEPVDGSTPHPVPGGLIHDWIGAVFVPKTKLEGVMSVLDDYDHYKDFYRPLVAKARVLERSPDHEKVTLLMVQKAYSVTAAVETDNDVQIDRMDADRAYSSSLSTHVRAIADYGQPGEHVLPEGSGPGYVWRTLIITRLQQRDDGVYVEMEMIGMSRGIPLAFRWLVQPLAERLPRIILLTMLKDARNAVSQQITSPEIK